MASVDSQLIEEVTPHTQSDSLEDAREICADSTYFPYNLCNQLLNLNLKATTKIAYHLHHLKFNYELYLITGKQTHWEKKNIFSPFCR